MVVAQALLFVSFAFAIFIYYVFKKNFRFWKERGVVYSSRQSIPWGSVKGSGFSRTIGDITKDLYEEFPNEKYNGIWLLYRPNILIRDPELIKSIFVRDFMVFHDRGFKVNLDRDPLAGHLFIIGGSKWRNLRVRLSPTFTSGKMKTMFPIMSECSELFAKVLQEPAKNGEVIEVKDYAARFTTDIISSAAFGLETNSLNNPDSEFRYYGQKIFEPTTIQNIKNLIANLTPDLGKLLRIKLFPDDVVNFFMTTLRETIAYRKENNIRRNDFLDLLIQLMDKGQLEDVDVNETDNVEAKKFTFEEAAAQAFVFFVAGFETSSTTMQYALYELAKNPEIQQKTREEIRAVLKKHNGEMSYESVMEMHYLSNVVDETLRMYPPVPFLQRECNKDYQIPDTTTIIPKDTVAIVPIFGIHHDPQYYPNPEKFDPNRFTEKEKSKRHNYSYLPFGEGPRNCIGMRFGLLQAKVGLLTLLNSYEFHVAAETPIPLKFEPRSFILTPVGGMNLKITNCKN